MSDEVLAVIPARGGSKGVPRKNVHPLDGKPLLAYAVEAARESRLVSRFLVSTEEAEVARLAIQWGSEVLERPVELARDDTPMVPVIRHAVESLESREGYRPTLTVILQPTAPLRGAEHVDACLRLLLEAGAGSAVSVSEVPGHYNPHWQFVIGENGELQTFTGEALAQIRTRRQDLPVTYTRNGAIYAFRTQSFLEGSSFFPPPCLAYVMEAELSVNVDTEEDFWLAERYLRRRRGDLHRGGGG